jgi:anti-sigma factor RsiW
MKDSNDQTGAECRAADISAFIDGELSAADENQLSLHLAQCAECSEELNRQKSFLNFVGSGLADASGPDLPDDFVRVITATAESGVQGLRGRREFLISMAITVVFGIGALLLLGGSYSGPGAAIFQGFADKTIAVVMAAGHAAYSISLGIAVIIRALTGGSAPAATALFVGVLAIISIPIVRFTIRRAARSNEA